jgi:hypothetical protein
MWRINRFRKVKLLPLVVSRRYGTTLTEQIQQTLESNRIALMKHIDTKNKKIWGASACVVGTTVLTGIYFYDDIKTYIYSEGADVATNTMNNPVVMKTTTDLSRQTLMDLCDDPVIQIKLTELIVKSLKSPEVRSSAEDLVHHICQQQPIIDRTSDFFQTVIRQQNIKDATKESLHEVILNILNDPYFQQEAGNIVYKVGKISITPYYFQSSNK